MTQKPLSETNGSVSDKLPKTNKHKRSPIQVDTTDKRKKIVPDEYDMNIDQMTEEVDKRNESPANRHQIARTPSMNKIISKIPENVKLTKINSSECGRQTQA